MPSTQDAAKQLADVAQRTAVQIAERPLAMREEGFAIAAQELRSAAEKLGIEPSRIEGLVEILMNGMRKFVLELDVGGKPQGGNA